MLCAVVLFILIAVCECKPRYFYYPPMCENKGSVSCSFQMADQRNDLCVVYNTKECQDFDFSRWMEQPPKHPTLLSDSKYSIDVSSYPLSEGQSLSFPALNITFQTLDKDVNGYVLRLENLENPDDPIKVCRIFDFRNSSAKDDMTFFYDCLVSLATLPLQNFDLKVTALPHNEEMLYSLYLPGANNIEPEDICKWRPTIMVFKGGFQKNIVEVNFSPAPKHLSVSSYEVSLLSYQNDEPVQTVSIEATQSAPLHVMFSYVDRGFYSVYIRPLSNISSDDCETVRCTEFTIENKLIDKIIIIYIVAVCVIGFLIAITIQLLLRWLFKPGSKYCEQVVLLVYSYDCEEHNKVVLRYKEYLEKQCGMKVLTIYGPRLEPDLWLFGPYRNCDIVMIILSEGVFYKSENGNTPAMKEGYSCGDRLIPALSFLQNKMLTDEKKFILVYFEYSGTSHIPSFMQSGRWRKAFMIPREMNYMLCEAHNQSPKISCLGVYPRMPGHDIVSLPEGLFLIESIEELKNILSKNDSLMMLNKHVIGNSELSWDSTAPHANNKEKLRKSKKARQPTNFSADEKREFSDCDSGVSIPSKQWHPDHSYVNVRICDECSEENCAHLNLLQDSELSSVAVHKPNSEFNEPSIQRNAILDVLDNTKEKSDRYIQDLQYILSKPGPPLPHFHALKIMK